MSSHCSMMGNWSLKVIWLPMRSSVCSYTTNFSATLTGCHVATNAPIPLVHPRNHHSWQDTQLTWVSGWRQPFLERYVAPSDRYGPVQSNFGPTASGHLTVTVPNKTPDDGTHQCKCEWFQIYSYLRPRDMLVVCKLGYLESWNRCSSVSRNWLFSYTAAWTPNLCLLVCDLKLDFYEDLRHNFRLWEYRQFNEIENFCTVGGALNWTGSWQTLAIFAHTWTRTRSCANHTN